MAYSELRGNSYLFGANAPFIEALYERYLEDPAAVEPRWRTYFDELQKLDDGARDVAHAPVQEYFAQLAKRPRVAGVAVSAGGKSQLSEKQYGVLQLIGAYRFQGARIADVDPLRRHEKPVMAELELSFYGLSDADMETVFGTGSLVGPREMKLKDIVQLLQDAYCRTIGTEYMYMSDVPQKRWIQERLEASRATPAYDAAYRKHILERLTAAETLERYLHTKYVGQTRFSLEGGDSLIPMLDKLLQHGGAAGVQELVIGMAHRGRLNVLVNTLGKMPKDLFAEFEGKQDESMMLAGDVKYHDGFSSNVMTPRSAQPMRLSDTPAPDIDAVLNPECSTRRAV